MANDSHEAHANHSAKPYIFTVLALYGLTILTFELAHRHLGEWSFVIAMSIAFVKGSCVVLFFMHLWDQTGPSRLPIAIAILFVLLLLALAIADVSTRYPLALPPGSFRSLMH